MPEAQWITITGSGFTPQSTLEFFDGSTIYYDRVPTYVNANTLRYDIRVGDDSANWTVNVLNGSVSSTAALFKVVGSGNSAAPAAPIGLSESFAGTPLTGNLYFLTWSNPSDPSGIATVWYKIGSAPVSATDGVGVDASIFNPLPIVVSSTEPVYVWLQDGAGNVNYNNYASVVLPANTNGPVLTISNPVYTTNWPVLNLSGTLADPSGTITSIDWANDLGGGGNFDGVGTNWTAPPIQLYSGANTITFTTVDDHTNAGVTSITVNYMPPTITDSWTGADLADPHDWNDANNWNDSRIPGSGDFVAISAGTVNIAGFGGAGLFLNGGTANWTGGTISGNVCITNTGTLLIDGGADGYGRYYALLTGVLSNAGTVVFGDTGGYGIYADAGGTINNLAGGTFDFQWGNINGGSPSAFNNAGLLEKSTNANGDSNISIPFNNIGGTISAAAGTLYFSGGGTSTGGTVAAGAGILDFSSGTQTLSGIWIGAGGTIAVGGGTLTVASDSAVVLANTAIHISGGAVGGDGTLSIGGGTWIGGQITGAGGLINTGTLLIDAGADGSGRPYAHLTGVLSNAGTVVFGDTSGYGIYADAGGTINNLAGGTFDFQWGTIINDGSPSAFNNAGLLEKSTNANGYSNINIPFNNIGGTISAAAGTLYFSDGGSSTGGKYVFDTGGAVSLRGDWTLVGTQTGTGNGMFSIDGATLNIPAGSSAALDFDSTSPVRWTGGTIASDGSITNTGNFDWTGGNMQGSGYFYNSGTFDWSGGTLLMSLTNTSSAFTVSGNGTKYIGGGGVFINSGTVTQADSGSINLWGNAATVVNMATGSYVFSGDGSISLEFDNYGIVEKTGGGNTTSIGGAFHNFGTVESDSGNIALNGYSQYSGSTILNGGNVSGGLTLEGGELTGIGAISGSINNVAGVIAPGLPLGYLVLNGSYTQGKAGTIDIEIGGTLQGITYDRFQVTGQATLDGTLESSFVNGFTPNASSVFNIFFYGSVNNQFAAMNLAPIGGLRPIPTYNQTGVSLSMTSATRLLVVGQNFTGGPSSQLTLQFNDDVSASLSLSTISLTEITTGITIWPATMQLSYNSATNTATWTFPAYPDGILPPGTYHAVLPARSVQNAAGQPLDTESDVYFVVGGTGANSYYLEPTPDGNQVEIFDNIAPGLAPTLTLPAATVSSMVFDLASGDDSINVAGGVTVPIIHPGTGNDTLNLGGGIFNINTNLSGTSNKSLSLNLASGASVKFGANQNLIALNLGAGAVAALSPALGIVLTTNELSLASGAGFDLADGTVLVNYTGASPAGTIAALIASAYASGQWSGPGITGSSTLGQPAFSTGVGYFDDGTQIKIGRTWYGDANVDGTINADDCALMVLGKATGGTRWQDGNFNYDTKVNADDWMEMLLGTAVAKGQTLPMANAQPATIQTASATVRIGLTKPPSPVFNPLPIDSDQYLNALLDSPTSVLS